MKKQSGMLNILLCAVVALTMLVYMLCRTFQPAVVLPPLNIPNLLILSVLALILNAYIAPQAEYCWIQADILAAITFGILPWVAGEIPAWQIWQLALAGGVIFAIAERIFSSLMQRIASGPKGKLAILATGLGLMLAGQCFAGMLL